MFRVVRLFALLAGPPLVAGACEAEPQARDTGEASPCAQGEVLDGEQCVPEACGAGTWGAIEVDGTTVFVDAAAAAGGDGSEAAPLISIQAGLDLAAARGGGTVAVAAGTYAESLAFGTDHGGIHLAGRCRDLVVIDASGTDSRTAGIDVDVDFGEVELSGLSVVDGNYMGVAAYSGTVRLVDAAVERCSPMGVGAARGAVLAGTTLEVQRCLLRDNALAVMAQDDGVELTLTEVEISNEEASSAACGGIFAQMGAVVTAQESSVTGSCGGGAMAHDEGTELMLVDTRVHDFAPASPGGWTLGMIAMDGALVTAEGCVIEGNASTGAYAYDPGSRITLVDTAVRDTRPDQSGEYGYGVSAAAGGTLTMEGGEVVGSTSVGVAVYGADSLVALSDTAVRDTIAGPGGTSGQGVLALSGSTVRVESCELAGNVESAITALERGTTLELRDTVVRDTVPEASGSYAFGLYLGEGAQVEVDRCEIAGSTWAGIFVVDEGTTVALRDSTVRDTSAGVEDSIGRGIAVFMGAELSADGCLVTNNVGDGVVAWSPGTQVALRDTVVRETASAWQDETAGGITVAEGAWLEAVDCEVVGNSDTGVQAWYAGTELVLRRCSIRDTRIGSRGEDADAIGAYYGAHILVEGCEVVDNASHGVLAQSPGTRVTLRDTSIRDTQPNMANTEGQGIQVFAGALVTAEDCELAGNHWLGAMVEGEGSELALLGSSVIDTEPITVGHSGFGVGCSSGGRLWMADSRVEGNLNIGVVVEGTGSWAELRDTTVTGTLQGTGEQSMTAIGVLAQMGAGLQAQGLTAVGNEGPGLAVINPGTWGSCTDCALLDNLFAGAVAVHDCSLGIYDSEISGNRESVDLGGGVGIYAAALDIGPPVVEIRDTVIAGNVSAGVHLAGEGSFELVGNEIEATQGLEHGAGLRCGDGIYASGVPAWDGSSGLRVEDNLIAYNQGAGLFLDDAHALLSGNQWSGNEPNLLAQGGACNEPLDSYDQVQDSELCPAWHQPACGLSFSFEMSISEIDPG